MDNFDLNTWQILVDCFCV